MRGAVSSGTTVNGIALTPRPMSVRTETGPVRASVSTAASSAVSATTSKLAGGPVPK